MPELPTLSGKEFIKFLETIGFQVIRIKGSHFRLRAADGRLTTVPVHGNKDLPKGLMRKIIKEDLDISIETFFKLYNN